MRAKFGIFMRQLLALLLCCTAWPSTPASGNLVANAGFERGLDDWQVKVISGKPVVHVTDDQAFDGKHSLLAAAASQPEDKTFCEPTRQQRSSPRSDGARTFGSTAGPRRPSGLACPNHGAAS